MTDAPRRPPGNLSHLQRLAHAAATALGLPVGRYQRRVSASIISAVLERARDRDGNPLFTLKGGMAMEVRFGSGARATRDYDATFRGEKNAVLQALDSALRDDWREFQFVRGEAVQIVNTNTLRLDVRLAYKGRPWGTVQLEVAPAEGRAGLEIDRLPERTLRAVQIDGPGTIACASVRYQIAQKLHACTEVFEDGRPNERVRDVIDLLLLRTLLDNQDLPQVREACVEVFRLRSAHAWPPELTAYPSWSTDFEALDEARRFEDLDAALTALRATIDEIDAARDPVG